MINRAIKTCLATAAVMGLLCATANASYFMRVGERTSQPVGHYEFCLRLPAECRPQKHGSRPLKLTNELWKLINKVNSDVNGEVLPLSDQELWGVPELWSYPERFGDCEDFVLEKRRRLIEAGIPAGYLLITVVRQSSGEGHAVLTVTTDRGDLVLDNINRDILPWAQTGYEFLKRQSSQHAGVWQEIIGGSRPMPVQQVASTESD